MNGGERAEPETELLVEVVRRTAAFDAFESGPLDNRGLVEALSVSRPTAHRIISSFEDRRFVRRADGGYELTPLGRIVGDAVGAFREEVAVALSLQPFLDELESLAGFDHGLFSTASITTVEPGDPYGPLARFLRLFEASSTVRGLDTTSIAPGNVERIHEEIAAGTEIDVVFEPEVVERLLEEYPELAADAFERDNVAISVHDDIPFGLALFDDRVGVSAYDSTTGTLLVFIDTDDHDAVAWGERVFERYKEAATPL